MWKEQLEILFCLSRHQFVENNLILKMGPVDKRKVSAFPRCLDSGSVKRGAVNSPEERHSDVGSLQSLDWGGGCCSSPLSHRFAPLLEKWPEQKGCSEAVAWGVPSLRWGASLHLPLSQGLFARRRQLLLTEGPHLYYVDPVNKVLKGEIPWSLELRPEAKNFKTFFVHTVSEACLEPVAVGQRLVQLLP